MAGGNIEEAQFVGPGRIIGTGLFDRIAGIAQVDEVDALDHPAIGNIETGNDTDADGHGSAPVGHGDRGGKIEPAFVQRPPGDDPLDPVNSVER